jgi:ABC-2 type transport system ATP-binding protein
MSSGQLALEISDLRVTYGPKIAVQGVSFSINEGEIFGLLGPNGAGKTSTLSAIEGLVKPAAGSITVDGIDARARPGDARAHIGVQLQSTSFQKELTIRELVRLYSGLYGASRSKSAADEHLAAAGTRRHTTTAPGIGGRRGVWLSGLPGCRDSRSSRGR